MIGLWVERVEMLLLLTLARIGLKACNPLLIICSVNTYILCICFFASFLPPDLSLTLPPKPSMYSHPFFSPYKHLALCLAPGFTSIKRPFPYSFLQSELVLRIESILSHQAVSFILFLSPWCCNNTSVIHLHPQASVFCPTEQQHANESRLTERASRFEPCATLVNIDLGGVETVLLIETC